MQLLDVTPATEATFLRCLHDEEPDDPRVIDLRRRWIETKQNKGFRAKVLKLDSGEIAGLCQYMPIAESHIQGENLMLILCLWVHGYDHHIGNRQGNGYGRFMLETVEAEIRTTAVQGIVAWGMDFPYWNPVSFYEHMGYKRVDQEEQTVLVWKPFSTTVALPQFHRLAWCPQAVAGRVAVDVFYNGWCTGGCGQCVTVRDAVAGLEEQVRYREIDTSIRENLLAWGISDGLFLDGEPYHSEGPPVSSKELRQEILKRSKR